ncbi:Oidioi.mRNA.OKI2018_I69.PAR.g13049.t1.cds [Oikopleura dioica]|uniref:Oidioi.mRNA.OKI2018_I69.PAR.g13049.t1.cds n=1 Tax=Oikopleura dioica TaxID=34765 RepID=A0ABN7S7G7_OIKDI|nr:Oidioi.mRNA.OKI2018_I69.PAR.g13049.t1.cds [Oikopleura dioica]
MKLSTAFISAAFADPQSAAERLTEVGSRANNLLSLVEQNGSQGQFNKVKKWVNRFAKGLADINTSACSLPAEAAVDRAMGGLCQEVDSVAAMIRSYARDYGCTAGYPNKRLMQKLGPQTRKLMRVADHAGKCSGIRKRTFRSTRATVASSHRNKLEAIQLNEGSNPTVMIVCGMRANDFESAKTCADLAENNNFAEDFPGMNFIIAPVANPSGYDYALNNDRYWTKTREANSVCVGTDLTRNFDVNFEVSDDPCSNEYSGASSLSTWEASALNDFISSQENLEALLVVETKADEFNVVTPTKQDSNALRKLLPRVFKSSEPFKTTRPQESRSGFLEDSFVGQVEQVATVQLEHRADSNLENLQSLVASFAEDITKKNSHAPAFIDSIMWAEDNVFLTT